MIRTTAENKLCSLSYEEEKKREPEAKENKRKDQFSLTSHPAVHPMYTHSNCV
jgi:hypothetical protein